MENKKHVIYLLDKKTCIFGATDENGFAKEENNQIKNHTIEANVKIYAPEGSNDYTDTTLGCIRISNLDVALIVKILQEYLCRKKYIQLEVK